MPDTSTILSLPYILPAQAQKHVTHNEALRQLDVIVQLAVTARNLAVPPVSPAQGDRYIVAAGASGGWAGKSGQIALFDAGAWQFFAPVTGWTAWIAAESVLASYNGSLWVTQADGPQNFDQIGISATADATNRLTVSSPATLLNHAGAGPQLKLNKAATSDTASLLFQTGFSGRAEMGTAGNDDFSIKVSANGSAFVTGLSIAAATGQVTLPAALRLGGQSVDPSSPTNGMIWLNSTTGEVKVRSNGASIVIASVNGVANAQLANMAAATFKGRDAGATGAPQDLTAAQAAALLPIVTSTARGLAPASGGGSTTFLRADGTWAVPPSVGGLPSLGITASAAQIDASVTQNRTNLIINGTGRINQRGYVTGTGAAGYGAFALDRWYLRVAGQSLSWTGNSAANIMTAPVDGVAQMIEGANIAGGTYCVSWVGTAEVSINGINNIPKGGTVTLPAGVNAEMIFWNGTFSQVQLELGTVPTPYQRLNISDELQMCQRYYARIQGEYKFDGNIGGASAGVGFTLSYPNTMRAAPTLSVVTESAANASGINALSTRGLNAAYVQWGWLTTGVVARTKAFTIQASAELTA